MVLAAFVGPCPDGMHTRHLNGNKLDNRLENLQWGTPKENGEDRVKHNQQPRGESHGAAKLRERDVREIRDARARGVGVIELARRYGVSYAIISDIALRKIWKHVS